MRISEAFDSYALDVIAFKNQSPKTEENHYVAMGAMISHFGDIDIGSLTFPMIRDYKVALELHRQPNTARNYIIRLRVVLAYLKARGVPCLSIEQIPVPKRDDKPPVFLSKEEVALCIDSTRKIKNKAIIAFLYASGIRISEMCAMDRGQIRDLTFTVIGKGRKPRLCFLDERSDTLIRLYLQSRQDNQPALFLTEGGMRIKPKTVQDTFREIKHKTGLDCHPHTLRHSFATNLLESNTNVFHVMKMMGHVQMNTTARYLHVVDHDLKRIYEKHHTV